MSRLLLSVPVLVLAACTFDTTSLDQPALIDDTGAETADTGDTTLSPDTGPADTGVVDADTGVVDTDTGVVTTDTGVVDTDTGVVNTDTGVVDTDTGVVDTDTGVVNTDTGVVDTDTGVVDTGTADTGCADADDDGICDDVDICPLGPNHLDADSDGTPDACDVCPGFWDIQDADEDGTPDGCDGCMLDPAKVEPGICGCMVADTDRDTDGILDCFDGCPDDPGKTSWGICGCGLPDVDTDHDGAYDCNDVCPEDPTKIGWAGVCGCGVPDVDSDTDGVMDCDDRCDGSNDYLDADHDGVPDGCDVCPHSSDLEDMDGDGWADGCDCSPFDPAAHTASVEQCDGVDNNCDGTSDGPNELGVVFRSFTTLGHDHGDPYWLDDVATSESRFGFVDELAGVWWLQYTGDLAALDQGTYRLDLRVRGGTTPEWFNISVTSARGCVTEAQTTWPVAAQPLAGTWGVGGALGFTVTEDLCPVRVMVWNYDGTYKAGYAFDWLRVVQLCDDAAECHEVTGAVATCASRVCDYSCRAGLPWP